MAVAIPKDDWTPAKLKTHQEWRKRMYGAPSVKSIPVRHLEAKISPPAPKPVEKAEIRVQVHFGYPILPVNDYKVFKFKVIQRAVALAAGISVNHLISQARQAPVIRARMIAIMLCKRFGPPDLSMPMLGKHFGGRDHTTILHSLRKTQPIAEVLDRRVNADAPLPQFVAAAFDAWDEMIQPRYEEIWRRSYERALATPKDGTRWKAK